jgi:hypothetical protein
VTGRNLSPRGWIRYWYGGFVLGIVMLIAGIAGGDVVLVFLGVAMLFFTPAMIAFWRRRMAEEPPESN